MLISLLYTDHSRYSTSTTASTMVSTDLVESPRIATIRGYKILNSSVTPGGTFTAVPFPAASLGEGVEGFFRLQSPVSR